MNDKKSHKCILHAKYLRYWCKSYVIDFRVKYSAHNKFTFFFLNMNILELIRILNRIKYLI